MRSGSCQLLAHGFRGIVQAVRRDLTMSVVSIRSPKGSGRSGDGYRLDEGRTKLGALLNGKKELLR